MPEPLLKIEHLGIEFHTRRGTLVAVDDISFDVLPGKVFGIVGESGAGKSLTGQAIIGLLEPPGRIGAGRIFLNDQRIDQLPYHQMRRIRGKKIGMIFQDPLTSLNPLYTVGKQLVETILTHSEMTPNQAHQHTIALLDEVGIPAAEKRIGHYPHQFSGGMRQRVVIALALCVSPSLIIADEPTTALDVSIQAQIIALLKGLCKEHDTAVILITHDMGVIAEISDRVAVMYAGRLVEVGEVRDIVKNPKHPYSQGLMGSIPSLHHKSEELTQIEGTMPGLMEIPPGCAFHPRCPHAFDRCRQRRPGLIDTKPSKVACWLFENEDRSGNT
ncbi:MAG: ABC transporter ATP-binding protein [Desulfobacterales bacterium]|jgi:peptide/nickel transport system ATP-binding protein|nr:ABC transporter ATP-binding protein [Desulfobacterales bacterium]MDP6684305.1 ABC transporter ATP-binding protein [Desulfobacterales bacterium]MDP6808163.1 ABC transporter ATP-binding protein [Desulfobacterales bacterium]|tara:strand:+ start:5718 stop:6704 length:987 start_codon:yes stop_codon:yes gene_type:complete